MVLQDDYPEVYKSKTWNSKEKYQGYLSQYLKVSTFPKVSSKQSWKNKVSDPLIRVFSFMGKFQTCRTITVSTLILKERGTKSTYQFKVETDSRLTGDNFYVVHRNY